MTSLKAAFLALCLLIGSTSALADPPKTLHLALESSETGFDPAQIQDLYSREMVSNIFDAPLRFRYLAPEGSIEPNVVDRMPEVSADFRTFTFHLKTGIYFTDDAAFNGQKRELVAADYVYSLKRFYDPRLNSTAYDDLEPLGMKGLEALRQEAIKSGHFDYDHPVDDIQALDRYTWRIHLGVPSPRFLANMALPAVYGAVAREVVERYGDHIAEHPVGTGPFMLSEWVRSSKMVFVRNPGYREDRFHLEPMPGPTGEIVQRALDHGYQDRTMPFVDRVEVSVVEESQPRWLAFLNGEIDYLPRVPSDLTPLAVPNNKLAPNLARKKINVERLPFLDFAYLIFNMNDKVFGGYDAQHVALRRAISLSVDTDTLIRNIYKGQALPAQSIVIPGLFGYDPDMRTENGDYDPARANAILDLYGYRRIAGQRYRSQPDGSPLVMHYLSQTTQRDRSLDEIFKRSFDAIGVELEIKKAQWPDNLKAVKAANFTTWSLGQSASGPDTDGAMIGFYGPAAGGANLSRFSLPAFDAIYREEDQLPDGPERLADIRKLQEILTAYAPAKFFVHRLMVYLAYPWVENIHHQAFASDWWRYVDVDTTLHPSSAR
jgi:ABC-type transport system substrate-binding protein